MYIARNYLFFIDKEKISDGNYKPDGKLRFRIRYNSDKIDFNVGYRVDIDKWAVETQFCKKGTTHGKKRITANKINSDIQRMKDTADEVFKSYEVNNCVPTVSEFRDLFNELFNRKQETQKNNLIFIFDEFINLESIFNNWTSGTVKKFTTLRNNLKDYKDNLTIEQFNETEAKKFVEFLFSKGYRNTSVAKDVSLMRWFFRWSYKKGLYKGTLHETFRPKFKGTDGNQKEIIHLTWDELMTLYNLVIPENKKYLQRVRDVFCFCCFTSLRYSDVAKLKRSDVKGTYIHFVSKKTTETLKIELNQYSKAILENYKDIHFENDLVLPIISNVKMNLYLKELGKEAGINEDVRIVYFIKNQRIEEVYKKHDLLTTHCGRRTFIVNALYLGIPPLVIMKWTGHSDYKAMQPYTKIVDELKENEMNKFNKI